MFCCAFFFVVSTKCYLQKTFQENAKQPIKKKLPEILNRVKTYKNALLFKNEKNLLKLYQVKNTFGFIESNPPFKMQFIPNYLFYKKFVVIRIPTVKLKNPGKSTGKAGSRTSITFKLKFLTLAIYQWQQLGLSKYAFYIFHIFSWWRTCQVPTAATGR